MRYSHQFLWTTNNRIMRHQCCVLVLTKLVKIAHFKVNFVWRWKKDVINAFTIILFIHLYIFLHIYFSLLICIINF